MYSSQLVAGLQCIYTKSEEMIAPLNLMRSGWLLRAALAIWLPLATSTQQPLDVFAPLPCTISTSRNVTISFHVPFPSDDVME
jgi:hypothetical protein